jgi:hypothetical protein
LDISNIIFLVKGKVVCNVLFSPYYFNKDFQDL